MIEIFYECFSLKSLVLSNFNTSNVININAFRINTKKNIFEKTNSNNNIFLRIRNCKK